MEFVNNQTYVALVANAYIRRERSAYILYRVDDLTSLSIPVQTLSPIEAKVLGLLSGNEPLSDIVALLARTSPGSSEQQQHAVLRVLTSFREFLQLSATKVGIRGVAPLLEFAESEEARLSYSEGIRSRFTAPLRLYMFITPRCQATCRYCNVNPLLKQATDALFMSLDEYGRIFLQAKGAGCMSVVLIGGDPLMHPEIATIVKLASSVGLHVSCSTRAFRGDKLCGELREAGLKHVQLSIDSLDADTVDYLSGPGAFDRVWASLRAFLTVGMPVAVNVVLTKYSIDGVHGLVDELLGMGVRRVSLAPLIRVDDNTAAAMAPSLEQKQRYDTEVTRLLPSWGTSVWAPSYDTFLKGAPPAMESQAQPTKRSCGGGFRELIVMWDGRCVFCDLVAHHPDATFGNLRLQSLLDLWNSAPLARLCAPDRSLYRGTPCHECSAFSECERNGRCYANALHTYGRFYAEDRNCANSRRQTQPRCV